MNHDARVVRELARQYAEAARDPIQEDRRRLWRDHNSRRATARVPVLATYGMWNVWCREVFGDAQMKCQDPFWRDHERGLRMALFHHTIGDDFILEPWLTVPAVRDNGWAGLWGVELQHERLAVEGGAWHFSPVIREWSDTARLRWPPHQVDETATARQVARLEDAIGDLLPIDVDRGPLCRGFAADISTHLAQLRGLEQLMLDMCEAPAELHRILAWMRDGIIANQAAADQAGDLSRTGGQNQCFTYCHDLPDPQPNQRGVPRKQLWAFAAAQEFTLISPAMHEEFLIRYQQPILEAWGLSAYGCCEDLTTKIDILRQVQNLRIIAVTPRADVRRCAEQIGTDYVISWRPNPTDMVCAGFDEAKIRRIIGEGLAAARGCHVHLHLKDIETVEGDPGRLARWVRIVRELTEG